MSWMQNKKICTAQNVHGKPTES